MRVAVNLQWTRKFEKQNPEFYGFHDAFENMDISPGKLIEHICAGHSYCACHRHVKHPYIDDQGRQRYTAYRCQQNWLPTSVLSLDFDTGDRYSSFDYLLADNLIRTRASFLYSTTSSMPQAPRTRVVFVTEWPVTDPLNYYDALCALSAIYVRNDKSAKDITKPYAGNKLADTVQLSGILSIPELKAIVEDWRRKVEEEERQRAVYFDALPKTVEYADVQAMLAVMPAKMDYMEWVKVLMAVHAVLPGEEGVALCEAWSPGHKNEIKEKFKSFNRGTKVSIAFLQSRAMSHGWTPAGMDREKRVDLACRLALQKEYKRGFKRYEK